MKGTTHVMCALAGTAFYNTFIHPTEFKNIPWLIIILGSLLPDIDESNSYISNPSKIVSKLLTKKIGIFCDWIIKILVLPLRLLSKHRGLTHSVLISLLLTILLNTLLKTFQFNSLLALYFLLAYWSHLFLDWLTPQGIPLMWPIKDKYYSAKLVTTGSFLEKILMIFFGSVLVVSSYFSFTFFK